VFYRVGGAGPPLLYLHGVGGAQVSSALRMLSDAHCIYAPILPGFDDTAQHVGAASMPALAAIIRAFITNAIGDRSDLVGHSFGGPLAMWVALDDLWLIGLERVSGIINTSPLSKNSRTTRP
jgi:pimeloyl-ACP methyl ester carboxylesterase